MWVKYSDDFSWWKLIIIILGFFIIHTLIYWVIFIILEIAGINKKDKCKHKFMRSAWYSGLVFIVILIICMITIFVC